MKKYTLLTLGLALAASTVAVAGVHTVGGGTPNAENTFPFIGTARAFRWQTMWFQSELGEAGPLTKIEWQIYDKAGGAGGMFRDCDILLCHTNVKALTPTFKDNYGGGTPVIVVSGTYLLAPSAPNNWIPVVQPKNFTYNNKDNLLIEVSWGTGVGGENFFKVRTSGEPPFPGQVYDSTSKTATTGRVTSLYHHYGRITFDTTGVNPTSLGRVKSIFK